MRITKQTVLESVLLALLASGVVGFAAWYLLPLSFRAQARLQVAAQPPRVLFNTVETSMGDNYQRYQITQQNLVKSRFVLGAALRSSKVSQCRMIRELADPIQWLQGKLSVEFIGGSELMEISLAGPDPDELACIVNAVKQAYMDEVVNYDARRRLERHEQLKKLQNTYTTLLKEKRDVMRSLAETIGSEDAETIAVRQQYAMEHMHDFRTQRFKLQLERSEVETLLGRRKKAESAATDPARKEIAQLEDRLAVVIAGQKLIDEDLEQYARNPITRKTLDLTVNQDEIARMQATTDKISAEVEALNVEFQAAPRIRTIDDATAPRTADDDRRWMMIVMLTCGAFFVALVGVAWSRVARVRPALSAGDASG